MQVFACRSVTVHEEALLAVGSVTYASGKQFIKYMERFFPVLEQGLTNHQVDVGPQVWQMLASLLGQHLQCISLVLSPSYSIRPALRSLLTTTLHADQEWQVCQSSVGVLSDITRAIEDQLFPYCNRIMQILLENLQSNEVNRNVKPHIISAFGDIALAIGDKFEYYIKHVVSMLQSAQVTSAIHVQHPACILGGGYRIGRTSGSGTSDMGLGSKH